MRLARRCKRLVCPSVASMAGGSAKRRAARSGVALGLLLVLGSPIFLRAAESPWFSRALVGMEVGPTGAQFGHSDRHDTRYCARFDGREIVRRCIAARCDYLVIWARDGDYAYYDSKLLPKAPGLGARDPLRETVDEARPHQLPVVAYCVVQQGGHFLDEHPEFAMRDAAGQPIGRFCLNSGYLAALKSIVAEQLACGINGFHIDMLDQGFGPPYGCWCETCRREFAKEFGRPLPTGATWDEDWERMLEFRYRSSERFEKALDAHIKSLNPGVSVDFNYHGNPPFSFEVGQRPVQHAGQGDFVTGETGVWGFSALGVSLNAEFYRAATPGRPFQVAMQRGVRMYHDQTTRPLNDLRWELFTLLAHGAFVTVVDKTAYDGGLDSVAYQRLGAAFTEAHEKRSHLGHAPVQEVGIYFSSRTRDWVGRDKAADYFQSFQGAHKALAYEHIPWGVVLDENATLESLQRFRVILLPNAGILTDDEIVLLRRYVEEGGKLLVTGWSGTLGGRGEKLNESVLAELVGAKFTGRLDSLDNWMRFPAPLAAAQGVLQGEIPADWPFLVKGPALMYEPTTATPLGQLLKPFRTPRQQAGLEGTDWPMSADVPVGPAILVNSLGRGEVVTFAASPDFATASEHHLVEARRLLSQAVRYLNPLPRVKITAPANVEAVVTDDAANRILRIHLLGYNSPPQTTAAQNRPYVLPGLIEDAPTYRIHIELASEIKHATAWNKATVLKHRGNSVEATVSDIHDVLVLGY
ncbi:MAG: hypothetical protein MUE50_11360 [Pirellulaceae bacterium]|nr:hypothetical protein [Pirellulaceae bacterium]